MNRFTSSIPWLAVAAFLVCCPVHADDGTDPVPEGEAQAAVITEDAVRGVVDSLEAALERIAELGLTVDGASASRAVVEAILLAADPNAEIVGESVESGTGSVLPVTNTVASAERLQDICCVKVDRFRVGTGSEVLAALASVGSNSFKGLILDLGGCTGVNLASVDQLAGLFMEDGAPLYSVSSMTGDSKDAVIYSAEAGDRIKSNVIILLGSDTSGSAELLAACLSGRKGILTMGGTTMGNARLREIVTVTSGIRARLGTRKVLPVNGLEFDSVGLVPDIEVSEADMKIRPQVQRAVDILVGLEVLAREE